MSSLNNFNKLKVWTPTDAIQGSQQMLLLFNYFSKRLKALSVQGKKWFFFYILTILKQFQAGFRKIHGINVKQF